MKTIEIYLFSGKLGTGKDFLANILRSMLPDAPSIQIALADHFKVDTITKDNIPYNDVYVKKTEKSRIALQIKGTEEGRDVYGEDIWTKTLTTWMKVYIDRGITRFFITDVRFPDELFWVISFISDISIKAYSFRIIAPGRNEKKILEEAKDPIAIQKIKNHASEIAMDGKDDLFDFIIKNDFEDDGISSIRDIVVDLSSEKSNKVMVFMDLDNTICHCTEIYRKIEEQVWGCLLSDVKDKDLYYKILHDCHMNSNTKLFDRKRHSEDIITAMRAVIAKIGEDFDSSIIDTIHNIGMSVHDQEFPIIEHAHDVLKEIKNKNVNKSPNEVGGNIYDVVILTLGEKPDQIRKLYKLGLQEFKCECVPIKNETIYKLMKHKYKAAKYIMIGDSYHNDIKPALDAGFDKVIHINNNRKNVISDDDILTNDKYMVTYDIRNVPQFI